MTFFETIVTQGPFLLVLRKECLNFNIIYLGYRVVQSMVKSQAAVFKKKLFYNRKLQLKTFLQS
jgi:hypothetical protein